VELSRGTWHDAIVAKHWEDFLDLSSRELMFYLQQRALTCHGNHADLGARALVAFEQNPPIRETAETVLCVLQKEHSDILKCCGVIEDPLEMEGWENNLSKWPKVHWADLRLYVREQGTFNRLYWSGNIRLERPSRFTKVALFIRSLYVKTINTEGVLLKAAVTPSLRIMDESHKIWVFIKSSGEVVGGYCTCTQLTTASAAIMSLHYSTKYNLQENTYGFICPSCTERTCSWDNSSNKDIQPKRVQDMVIVEHARSNANPKFTINNNTKRSFDPRHLAQRCVSEECKQCFLSKIKETLSGAVINILHPQHLARISQLLCVT